MHKNPNQPKDYDAVKGGKAPAFSGVVLGGIKGVKRRLGMGESPVQPKSIEQRIAALKDALKKQVRNKNIGMNLNNCFICKRPVLELRGQFEVLDTYLLKKDDVAYQQGDSAKSSANPARQKLCSLEQMS